MRTVAFLFVSIWLCMPSVAQTGAAAVPDTPFVQEYHEPYPLGHDAANDVRAVAADGSGNVWAATKDGLYLLNKPAKEWSPCMTPEEAGPTFDVCVDAQNTLWLGAWNGLYRGTPEGLAKVAGIDAPVAAVCPSGEGVIAAGPDGFWRASGDNVKTEPLRCARSIRAVLDDPAGGVWIATGQGLTHRTQTGDTRYLTPEDILSCDLAGVAYAPDGRLWVGGLGGVTVFDQGKRVTHFTPKEGLPGIFVKTVACAPDGVMWVGTDKGAARYDGKSWSLRHSRRWLLSDEVRDVAFDAEGTAWVATGKGVSAIKRKTITLAEKAAYYYEMCMARHVRDPWIVEKCVLPNPGDLSKWEPVDDDNDGQYTAMYLAMESFRYATTKDPDAQEKARRAFETLRLLQTVTGTPGFVARTVVPPAWTRVNDANRKYSDRELAEDAVSDPRYKPVEARWRPSSDGKWLWKGDTSSDEITGHFYGYLVYYDLAADETQREVVRAHVRRVMDYIIDHGYVLVDIDGKHTHWGVWAPERLNGDPDWAPESGINATEVLSYLKATYHITGDEKYEQAYRSLLQEHHYTENVRRAKTFAPAWRTHIDDELLALAYPALLLYEKDPDLQRLYRESLDRWYGGIRPDQSPYFNFVYGGLTGADPELTASVAYLRDVPLDLIQWTVDNSRREDVRLVRAPEIDPLQTDRMLPPSECTVMRWDKNPWVATEGGEGRTEWCPVYWLLPYWMGRYYGFIGPAS